MTREIKNGILYFDGCNTVELAKKYGTPLYVMSENDILERFSQLKEAFIDKYPNARVAYACKAFCTSAMMKICEREGMCIDVVSGGELYTALKAGFPPERIEFNGNNKLPDELKEAIDCGIGRIIVDGIGELEVIEEICKKKGKKVNILYRITPGIKADSHDYIITGKKDSKFGMPQDEEELYSEVKKAIDSPFVEFLGFHFHIGSQLFEKEPYIQALNVTLNHIKNIKDRYGFDIKEINMGGGFGVTYTDEERKPYSYFIDPLMDRVKEFCKEEDAELPALVIEPGRSIVAEAGISLYTVGRIKNIPGIRKYVSVDGGMTDNIRPALYQAEYEGIIANKADYQRKEQVTVCGKCCESGDILMRDIEMAEPEAGDTIAIFSTGAYGYSMASNYNRNPIPAVVLVKDGKDALIVRRQTYENMISNDIVPDYLK
ncbi:MAG: diaminopimelate decarboxylase [Clostridiales bacterium]|nr:MAG: diaminopimelate decarboxylase [Clostridiales bacterium]